jgi:hypothetical protein
VAAASIAQIILFQLYVFDDPVNSASQLNAVPTCVGCRRTAIATQLAALDVVHDVEIEPLVTDLSLVLLTGLRPARCLCISDGVGICSVSS